MDDFNWDVVINLAVKGANGSVELLNKVTDAVDSLNRAEQINPSTAQGLTQGINRAGRAAQSASQYIDGLGKAQSQAVRQAESLAAAQSRLSAAVEKNSFESSITGLERIAQAQARVTKATEDRARAEQAYDRAQQTGNISQQIAATNQLTTAITAQTRAQQSLDRATQNSTTSLAAYRYANYDAARTMFVISGAITGIGVGLVSAAASYESAFASVERTTGAVGAELDGLRNDLLQLTREIPQTFGDVASLAARGAQLGIASDQIKDFTEVVAQFVATSDTVTLDQAVEAFGRISNLLGDSDFNALGSAITLVGVNAAATEAQIVKTTQELAPFAAAVGMSSEGVIGLAAAVASLGQPPERARSAFLTLQKVVDGAVSGMNDKLGQFAAILGKTEAETAALWKSDPTAFVQSFVKALGATENLTVAFDALGINERRAVQVFQALAADSRNAAGGMSVLDRAISDSNRGYAEGTELQRQYSIILETLASKWQILQNAIMEFAAAAGTALLPTIKSVVDVLTVVFQNLADFASSDIGQSIMQMVAPLAATVAAFTALRGAVFLANGSVAAFRMLAASGIPTSLIGGLRALAGSFFGVSGAARTAAGGVAVFGKVLKTAGIIGLISIVISFLTDLRGSVISAVNYLNYLATSIAGPITVLKGAVGVINGLMAVMNGRDFGQGFAQGANNVAKAWNSVIGGLRTAAGSLPGVSTGMENLSNTTQDAGYAFDDAGESLDDFGKGMDDAGKAAEGAAEKIRTVLDYANDLSSVLNRAFELRFGVQNSIDATTQKWLDMRKAIEDSERKIRDLEASIRGLKSDISTDEYFLSIALQYGDTKRAEEIQRRLADKRQELADKTKDLAKEEELASKNTEGNTEGAIKNRKALEDLVASYRDQLVALANSGLSQDELRKKVGELRKDFIKQATDMGYSEKAVNKYAGAFDDMYTIVDKLPREVTPWLEIKGLGPALAALREFAAKVEKTGKDAGSNFGNGFGSGLGGSDLGLGGLDSALTTPAWEEKGRYTGRVVGRGINDGFSAGINGFFERVKAVTDAITQFFKPVGDTVRDVVNNIIRWITDPDWTGYGRKVGKGVSDGVGQGINPDTVKKSVQKNVADQVNGFNWGGVGKNVGKKITDGVAEGMVGGTVGSATATKIKDQVERSRDWLGTGKGVGKKITDGVSQGMDKGTINNGVWTKIGSPILGVPWLNDYGRAIGRKVTDGVAQGMDARTVRDNTWNKIGAQLWAFDWWDQGRQMGRQVSNGFVAGFGSINVKPGRDKVEVTNPGGRSATYNGTNVLGQLNAGLPGAYSAVSSQASSQSAPTRLTVDLSAATIQQIGQVMDKFIVVDGKIMAQTTTKSNQFTNAGGGN